jgi:hypothetical protein
MLNYYSANEQRPCPTSEPAFVCPYDEWLGMAQSMVFGLVVPLENFGKIRIPFHFSPAFGGGPQVASISHGGSGPVFHC